MEQPVIGVAAAVLIGGLSRRMGRDKALLDLGDRRVVEHVLAAARAAVEGPVCLVGREGVEAYVGLADELVRDAPRPRCPLAGIEAAVRWSPRSRVLVLACDLPLAPAPLLAALARHDPAADAVLIEGPHGLEPLVAAYGTGCLAAIERAFAAGRLAATAFLEELRAVRLPLEEQRRLDPEGRASWNMNTPEEYRRIAEAIARA